MKKIGVTETYDPHFINGWENNLKDINIIITKQLSDDMINKIILNKDKIILHLTCTGNGGNIYEPNVPNLEWTYNQFKKLINKGFPMRQCVLRIDPIIPNDDGFNNLKKVLEKFSNFCLPFLDMLRCRISVMDNYEHVKKRFKEQNILLSTNTFHSKQEVFNTIQDIIWGYVDYFSFESCAESLFDETIVSKISCVSGDDISILDKTNINEYSHNLHCNRNNCGCLEKVNILKVKPSQCPHKCIYCYWKTDYKD